MNFLSKSAQSLKPYIPGEQLNDKRYIKLNTNESPYAPGPAVESALASAQYGDLRLYSDPQAADLRKAIAEARNVEENMVFTGGGSDEILGYAFMAFFDRGDSICYPDITYGFYQVLANLLGLNAVELPVDEDFNINPDDYTNTKSHIVIANPNAPTGISLNTDEIERILTANPNRLFIADEAYVDFFDGKGCEPLLKRYSNLLIVRTFSKSYAMAGMRIGYALGAPELIDALDRVKNSFNPYNLDRISILTGIAAVRDECYLRESVKKIVKTREDTRTALQSLGFSVLPSDANFLFARHEGTDGEKMYKTLKDKGILVRHFNKPRIHDFIRISIGTPEDMDKLLEILKQINL